MQTVAALLRMLDLAPDGPDRFLAEPIVSNYPRVFGGQVIAQALVAACRTVEGRLPHSLHAQFVVGADAKRPIDFVVHRIRDGGSFSIRRVEVRQSSGLVAEVSLSFHVEESGFTHAMAMPAVAGPDGLPTEASLRASVMSGLPDPAPRFYEDEKPIELRPVEHEIYFTRDERPPNFNMWLRATASLPDDPVLHRAFLAFMSDMTLQDASLLPHGHTFYDFTRLMTASLDHCVWFHGPVRVDSWLLYVQDSPWAGGARGLSRGSFFAADGRLVASTAQEGMIRQRRSRQA